MQTLYYDSVCKELPKTLASVNPRHIELQAGLEKWSTVRTQ